ncbi:unnamed protein product, partial [Ectocarpus sp. 6 AP-2014]
IGNDVANETPRIPVPTLRSPLPLLLLCSVKWGARPHKQTARQPRCCCVWRAGESHSETTAPISFHAMSFRGRPSLSGTPGRSSLEPSSDSLDLAKLRADLVAARELTCFQARPDCQSMIDDVLTSCLPVAAMAESTAAAAAARLGAAAAGAAAEAQAEAAPVDASGVPLPRAPAVASSLAAAAAATIADADAAGSVSSMDWDPSPTSKQIAMPPSSSSIGGGAGRGGSGVSRSGGGQGGGGGGVMSRRASGLIFADRVGITRIPDRAWTIALDYLELGEGMRCRQLGRAFRDTVEASLSVLALSGVNTITWATPDNLAFLTRFKNVRTLHW